MVNEADLPQFAAGPMTPIGQLANPRGIPIAPKKDANMLLKRIMQHAKPAKQTKARPKSKTSGRRTRTRGIEADQKVHIGSRPRYY